MYEQTPKNIEKLRLRADITSRGFQNNPCPAGHLHLDAIGLPVVECRIATDLHDDAAAEELPPRFEASSCVSYKNCIIWRDRKHQETNEKGNVL